MKKLVVLIIAVLACIGGYTTYAYAMPEIIPTSHVVFVKNTSGDYNQNSDADENLPDGLKPLNLHKVYAFSKTSTVEQPVSASVEPYLGQWTIEKQIGKNPYTLQGQSPIGKTITITQSNFVDPAKNTTISMKNPYYTTITIPYQNLTQDYDINLYDQCGLPKTPLKVLIVNPNKKDVPLQDPEFNTDALFIDNGNLVVVDGLSFYLCKQKN